VRPLKRPSQHGCCCFLDTFYDSYSKTTAKNYTAAECFSVKVIKKVLQALSHAADADKRPKAKRPAAVAKNKKTSSPRVRSKKEFWHLAPNISWTRVKTTRLKIIPIQSITPQAIYYIVFCICLLN
jgi:hypothetical protein